MMESKPGRLSAPLRVSLIYLVLGVSWILASDVVLSRMVGTAGDVVAIEIAKGSAFVVATAVFIYLITARELRQREQAYHRLETLIDAAPLGIVAFDADQRPTRWNEAAERIFGWTARPQESDPGLAVLRPHLTLEAADGKGHDVRFAPEGREAVDLRVFSVPFVEPTGRTGWLALARDRSTETTLEAQLLQAQKMEVIGRLAGGVAHDFNNVLTAILGHADLLAENLPEGEQARADADEIRRAARRAGGLTRQLLFISRKRIAEPRPLCLNDVVHETSGMLRRIIGEDVECVSALDPELHDSAVDPGQLEQIILNLAVNARDAMPSGGTLLVETANTRFDAAFASSQEGLRAGPYVMLAVSDTGTGMDEQTRARAFEPFFTTKKRGTGLGLSSVYGIVKQHRGHVSLYSEPSRGTTFKLYFPALPEKGASAPDRAGRTVTGNLWTILLADDDPAVRNIVVRTLRTAGHTVYEAATGNEAVEHLTAHGAHIDLLITDIVMPDLAGPELAERARAIRPELRVLYISGYTAGALEHFDVLPGRTFFLEKPFGPESLRRKIGDTMAE